jgi:hypothetical protein
MRNRVLIICGVLTGCFMIFMAAGAFAANPQGVSVSANVSPGLELTMSSTTINFGGAALAPGSSYNDSTTATVNSNKLWSLKVKKDHDLTYTTYTIPSSNLTYTSTSTNPGVKNLVGTATEFSASDASACSGCDRGSSMSLTINYSLSVPWTIEPGVYTATHTYTATQP